MTDMRTREEPAEPLPGDYRPQPIIIESISERERLARRRRAPLKMGRAVIRWTVKLAPALVLLTLLAFLLARA